MTNVDKALLLAEWSGEEGDGKAGPTVKTCPICHWPDVHGIDCAMDLALGERGFYTREERERARHFLATAAAGVAATLPPMPHAGLTTTHVLFEGRPLCGFWAAHTPKSWPPGHNWVSIVEVVEREPGVLSVPTAEHCEPCERCASLASATTLTRSRA